jgi:cytochrome b pre-mRNA-processing protein 3
MIFGQWFKSEAPGTQVRRVYDAIVAQARQPVLYRDLEVPDTVSGRFDMIILHAFLVLERLRREDEAAIRFAQDLTDELFRDMDRSLREMGVGDLSVGKKVRRMAEVFHGRLKAYAAAAPGAAFTEVVKRNVYAGSDTAGNAGRLATYAQAAAHHMAEIPVARLMAGEVDFGGCEQLIEDATR